MKFQSLFSGEKKKNIISLSSAELARRLIKDELYCGLKGETFPYSKLYFEKRRCGAYGYSESLRKHGHTNILKISPTKYESFQIKILIFFIFLLKT